jgi:hypothetical protein
MDTEFFADVVTTGTVHGVDSEVGPDVVNRVLGTDYGENVDGSSVCHSYELAEFFWYRRPRGMGWQAHHFTVQAHRLDRRSRFADLRAELDRRGLRLTEVGQWNDDYQQFWQPSTEMTVLVQAGSDEVWKIASAFRADLGLSDKFGARRKAVLRTMDHVRGLSEPERLAWLERENPDADWWRHCCVTIAAHALTWDKLAERESWTRFALWALARDVLPPAWAAVKVAELWADLVNRLPDTYPSVPSADAVVATCLRFVTGTMSRADKNLIDMAALHRHALEDTTALDKWLAVRTDIPTVASSDC